MNNLSKLIILIAIVGLVLLGIGQLSASDGLSGTGLGLFVLALIAALVKVIFYRG